MKYLTKTKIFTFLTAFIMILSAQAYGQLLPGGAEKNIFEDESPMKPMDSSLFLDLSLKLSQYDKKIGYDLGLKVGAFASTNFSIAIGINYLLSQNIVISRQGEFLSVLYIGFTPEFVLNSYVFKPLYFYANCYLAAGYADYNVSSSFVVSKAPTGTWFALAEPQVGAYAQITKDFAFGLGVGKRFATNITLKELDNQTFSGYFGLITFRVLLSQ